VHAGFNRKVLARLLELDAGPQPLRFWVAGAAPAGAPARCLLLDERPFGLKYACSVGFS
jgi:hypothetical protein